MADSGSTQAAGSRAGEAEQVAGVLARLANASYKSGTNGAHEARPLRIKDLKVDEFDFNGVSATVSSVATGGEVADFFEKLSVAAGVTSEQEMKKLNGAFVFYIIKNGCSDRQDFSKGQMQITFGGKEKVFPAGLIPDALPQGMGLRRIGNALADLCRNVLLTDSSIMDDVLRSVADWSNRPRYPSLVLESASFCTGLSTDEKKFAAMAKKRRLKNSEDDYHFADDKIVESYFNVSDGGKGVKGKGN